MGCLLYLCGFIAQLGMGARVAKISRSGSCCLTRCITQNGGSLFIPFCSGDSSSRDVAHPPVDSRHHSASRSSCKKLSHGRVIMRDTASGRTKHAERQLLTVISWESQASAPAWEWTPKGRHKTQRVIGSELVDWRSQSLLGIARPLGSPLGSGPSSLLVSRAETTSVFVALLTALGDGGVGLTGFRGDSDGARSAACSGQVEC